MASASARYTSRGSSVSTPVDAAVAGNAAGAGTSAADVCICVGADDRVGLELSAGTPSEAASSGGRRTSCSAKAKASRRFGSTVASASRSTNGDDVAVVAVAKDPESDSVPEETENTHNAVMDAAAMKEKVRLALVKHKYDVCDFYKTQGVWQAVARHAFFERLTLAVIMANALWIAVDTDCNTAEILVHAHPIFQIAENLFCAFFSAEWLIRFTSFRRKLDSLRDGWFVFDMMMCVLMVVETWLFTIFVLVSGGGAPKVAGGAIARIARLMRLSRMCRMAKILRAMPELFVMLKGLRAAGRSVFFTLLLLTVIIFIFGIAFTQLAKETVLADAEFATVLDTSHFLLVHGTLLLSTDARALRIGEYGGWELETLFFVFILVAAVLLMNMLIGVLCEVVSAVSAIEQEEILVRYVESELNKVMALIDEDGGGTISRDEFNQILDNKEAIDALQDIGIDVIGLVDFADFIFDEDGEREDGDEVELTMPEFMEVVLQLRGSNNATVKDIVDLRKFIRNTLTQVTHRLDTTDEALDVIFGMIREMNLVLREVVGNLSLRSVQAKKLAGGNPAFALPTAPSTAPPGEGDQPRAPPGDGVDLAAKPPGRGVQQDLLLAAQAAVAALAAPVAEKATRLVPGVPGTAPPTF
eukprot:TRINITY_DN9967_c1_g4_i2.p1 TRINITY_DN9967_c1_g4~~TRINITY_DN9967_c1_g4_i2.p1  ORF type:complete len:655 (-),score=141.49 TRINITY_DN9967_c1_g4_i2:23-1951(-)